MGKRDGRVDYRARRADRAASPAAGQTMQRFDKPNSATFIGGGKVEEVKLLIEELDADVVIFDDELLPRHQRELEEVFGEDVKVIDRTALILDIFAQHAQTREGKLQVELCLLYTSDAADQRSSVDLGGRRIIKKKKTLNSRYNTTKRPQKQIVESTNT